MLADLVETLTALVEKIITTTGVFGIWLIALFENLFPPTPSETIYPLVGKMAYDGKITVLEIVLAGTLGSLTGALIFYTLGYQLGDERVQNFIARYGVINFKLFRVTIISLDEYREGIALFQKRGNYIVFVARLIPLVHGVVSIPAGVARMNLPQFCIYTALGSAAWIGPLTLLGYWLGEHWDTVLRWLDVYEYGWYAIIVAFISYYIYRRYRKKQQSA